MYEAKPLGDRPGLVPEVLAADARGRGLTIVAGAGISRADPTDLPDGDEVARRLAGALQMEIPVEIESNLLAIADLVEGHAGGGDRLQQILPTLAGFATRPHNFGHRALALLVSETAIELLLTNWDDCVERADGDVDSPRLEAVVNDADAQERTPPRVFKLHGCARRQGSLLVSQAQIANPPSWALDNLRSRLANVTVAFLGIGDIPSYVRLRLEQIRDEVDPQGGAVWLIARGISDAWNVLLPALPADRRLAIDADDFLDDLVRAYCWLVLEEAQTMAEDRAGEELPVDIRAGFGCLLALIQSISGEALLRWALESSVEWPPHTPMLDSAQARELFLALAVLCELGGLEAGTDSLFTLDNKPLHTLICDDRSPPSAVPRHARDRIRSSGAPLGEKSFVLYAGPPGPAPSERAVVDVSGSSDPNAAVELLEASSVPSLTLMSCADVMAGHVP